MKVAIVEYPAGNVRSVMNAFARLGVEAAVTADPAEIASAGRVVFPGVGEASTAMERLRATGLDAVIRSLRQPVLGICLGLQLLCARTEEGGTGCLGIFPAEVRRFPSGGGFKVPHMGWNSISRLKGRLFEGVPEGAFVYFVHSFCAGLMPQAAAVTEYAVPFSSAAEKDNFFAVQFHPEKSGEVGKKILENFLRS